MVEWKSRATLGRKADLADCLALLRLGGTAVLANQRTAIEDSASRGTVWTDVLLCSHLATWRIITPRLPFEYASLH